MKKTSEPPEKNMSVKWEKESSNHVMRIIFAFLPMA